MNPARQDVRQIVGRAARGAVCGAGGTVALTGLRRAMDAVGLVGTTAPQQVVGRLEELGLLGDDPSPGAQRVLSVVAHFAYGAGIGAVFGFLRRERGGAAEEASVGAALGILSWGVNWASWLPLAGVHLPPWKQRTPRVLLPVLDHAVFGAVWGLLYRTLGPNQG